MKCKKFVRKILTALLAVALVFGSVDVAAFVSQAATNAYEATSGDHGATYDAANNQVTFFVKSSDAFYGQVEFLWYKEYASYEAAAAAHISNGGDFIAGVGATPVTANGDNTEKTATVNVTEGTGAILYYFNAGAGHGRLDYEHIIVIAEGNDDGGNDAGGNDTPPIATGDPHGATYDATSNQVTFFIQNNDAFYGQTSFLWYKEYATVAEAEAAHISNGGDFIAGVGATNLTANAEGTKKEVTVTLADTTAAVLYYFNAGAGHARPDYEHVFAIEKNSGNTGGEVVNPSYINVSEKGEIHTNNAGATFTTDETSVTVTSADSGDWGNFEWWAIQYFIGGIDVTAGEYEVEYDIFSTVNKPAYFKLTTHGGGNDDTPIIEKGNVSNANPSWTLTANETEHVKQTATIGADGKVRLFFNLAGGTDAGYVKISNIKVTKVESGEKDPEPVVEYVNVEENGEIHTNNAGATFTTDETSVTVTSADSGDWGNFEWWAIQYFIGGIDVTAGDYEVEFDILSTVNKPAYFKLTTHGGGNDDTPIIEKGNVSNANPSWTLTANETEHVKQTATIGADGKVRLFFNLAGGTDAGYVKISNITVTKVESEEKDPESEVKPTGNYINLEEKKAETGAIGGWNTDTATYAGAEVTLLPPWYGSVWDNAWALQNVDLAAGDWIIEYDITADADKAITFQLTKWDNDGAVTDVIVSKDYTLNADNSRTYHGNETVTIDADGKFRLLFAVGATSSATNVKISNIKVYQPSEYIDLEAKKAETGAIGGWNTDTATYAGAEVTLLPPWYGSVWDNAWALQNVDFTVGNWTVEYDITTDADKAITFQITKWDNDGAVTDVLVSKEYTLNDGNSRTYHGSETVKIDAAGKFRLLFAVGAASSATNVKISNIKIVKEASLFAPELSTTKLDKVNGFKIGENVVLNFTDDAAWREAISAVKINAQTVAADKYTVAEGTLTLDSSLFAKQGIYSVEVLAEGHDNTSYTLPVYNASAATENWTVEWVDEFEGTSLDSDNWACEIGIKSGDDNTSSAPAYWGNSEKQYYTSEAATVADGKLVITAAPLTDEIKAKYDTAGKDVSYSSARIRTVSEDGSDTLYGTKYGRVEASISLPEESGYWPAFWMLPTNETTALYGGWPASGEIDIMEAGQNVEAGKIDGTLHYGSAASHVYKGGNYYLDSVSDYHTYAIEWEPGEIRWYVDDILYHVENNWYGKDDSASDNYAYPAPFDGEFYILLNLAVGGNYIGNKMPNNTTNSMKIDYVKVSKLDGFDYNQEADKPDAIAKDAEFYNNNKSVADANGNYFTDANFATVEANRHSDGGAFGDTFFPETGIYYLTTPNATVNFSTVGSNPVFAKFDIAATGNYTQLNYHAPLAKGYTYKLSFDAYTDDVAGRTVAVAIKGDSDNAWVSYEGGFSANLTSEVQTFESVFTMSNDSDPTTRFEFDFNKVGNVYLGNVKLVAMTDEEVEDYENEKLNGPKEPLANGNHIYNGSFDQGTGKLGYWNTDGDYTADTSNRTMKAVINSSSDIDDASISQYGVQLLAKDTYVLTLDAKADADKDIKIGFYSKDGATTYYEVDKTIGTSSETITVEFTMPNVSDVESVFTIAFGGDTTSVEIDNVSMKRTTNMNVAWNAAILYPLGGDTWADYSDYEWGNVTVKPLPADGVITENMAGAGNNYDYMIFKRVGIKSGHTYKLTYDIKTSVAGQKIITSVQQDQTWVTLSETTVSTTTNWQTVSKQFTATTEGNIDLKFLLSDSANSACEVSIQNVELVVVGAPYLEAASAPTNLKVGNTFQLNVGHTAVVNPEYEVYTYTSDNASVATVSSTGLITAKAAGDVTITVTSGTGAKLTFDITVTADTSSESGGTGSTGGSTGGSGTGSADPTTGTTTDTTTTTGTTTTTTETPVKDTTTEVKVDEVVEETTEEVEDVVEVVEVTVGTVEDWEAVAEDLESVITEAEEEGKTAAVEVEMDTVKEISSDVLNTISGKDVKLTLNMGNGVNWVINGKNVAADASSNINMNVKMNDAGEIPEEKLQELDKHEDKVCMSLEHTGEFGFEASLVLDFGLERAGAYANLFYYNPSANEFEFAHAALVDDEGRGTFPFKHASDYVIIFAEAEMATVLAEEVTVEDTDVTETAPADDSEVDVVEPAEEEGGMSTVLIIVIILLVIAAGVAAFVVIKKKKDE